MVERLKERTSKSFGFEWSKFPDIYAEYEQNFLSYIFPIDREFFKDKVVLDAGCGAGRHAYFAAKWGARFVVAMDASKEAVRVTYENTKDLANVTVACLDINHMPAALSDQCDYVFSLGVLHHLSDPQSSFSTLVPLLKSGGVISIWVYGKKDNALAVYLYEPVRKVTTRIPHKLLYYMALVPASMMQLANWIRLPIFSYYSRFPFRTKWNDSFDVFSAPSAKYYTLEEIQGWFEDAGLKDIRVSYRVLEGKAKGIKGFGVKP